MPIIISFAYKAYLKNLAKEFVYNMQDDISYERSG